MVKIMLKKPVGGQLNPQGGAARALTYLEAGGSVTEDLKKAYDAALQANTSLSFVSPQGNAFLVAARNIAYLLDRSTVVQ